MIIESRSMCRVPCMYIRHREVVLGLKRIRRKALASVLITENNPIDNLFEKCTWEILGSRGLKPYNGPIRQCGNMEWNTEGQ